VAAALVLGSLHSLGELIEEVQHVGTAERVKVEMAQP